MTCTVLVLVAGPESYLGLWRPAAPEPWLTVNVTPSREANSVLTALAALQSQSGITLKELTHIGVMAGPASYTQLRVFVTTANTLAWIGHLPLFGFPPTAIVPQDLPQYLSEAKVNVSISPIYPSAIA